MKILVTSDLHGNLNGLEDFITPDLNVICFAGDVALLKNLGKWHVYDQKKWVQKTLCTFAEKYPNIEFVFTPGNHDFFPIADKLFGHADCNWHIIWPNNLHMLIDSGIDINGIKFYGTPYVPIISHRWAFEAESDELKRHFQKIPENIDVLLTHSPPHITMNESIDRSMQWGGHEAFGSSELATVIFDRKPRYAFCGHIHTGGHECFNIGETKCYNVSRLNENYEIAFDPFVFEIEPIRVLNEA